MKYEFPIINHLDDVRPAIAGSDEFIIAERDWGYVVNYIVSMPDTFPEVKTSGGSAKMREEATLHKAIRRECRGLLFDKEGNILSRRLHKFFNINERDETQFNKIDFSQSHVILEKLDGSMITPILMPEGNIRWGTKMGVTDVAMGAEEFVARNQNYEQLARVCISSGITPIFEWCSRKQRIVVDYPEDRLVLIAARETKTGMYYSYRWLQEYAEMFEVDLVKTYPGTPESMAHLMDETKDAEGIEGWIIRFDDGHMLKIKGEWYLKLHKTKEALTQEKNLIDLIVNDKIDDAKPFMVDEDRDKVNDFQSNFWYGVNDSIEKYEKYFQTVIASGLDRKQYAQQWMPTIKDNDSFAPTYVFARFDNKDPRELILNQIKRNIGTSTKVETVRNLWGGYKWSYYGQEDYSE
jgi:RNA ligase